MGTSKVILFILCSYMLVNMFVGIVFSRRKSVKKGGFLTEYFMGGRTMGGLVLAMTLVCTYTSASSFLGAPGLAASWGLTQSWVGAIQIGTAFLTLGVMGKKLAIISRKIDAVTVVDYLKVRYESTAVVVTCSICLVVFFITQMIAQFIGGATLIQTVTGLKYEQALFIFGFIVVMYTAVGGFKAVVTTDTIQGIIMTVGTVLMFFFVLKAGGGMGSITDYLNTNNPGWNLLGMGEYAQGNVTLAPGMLISYWVLVGVGVLGLPQTAVRGMGFKDTQSMHRAMIFGTVVVGILMIGMLFTGALMLPIVPKDGSVGTDAIVPYVVLTYMPSWAAGLFLAAPLAAVMSTVDSLLILASATIIKELLADYIFKNEDRKDAKVERKLSVFSHVITVVIGALVCVIALSPPDLIVWINLFAMGGLESTFFWPMLGGIYWKGGNRQGCIASIIVSVATFVFFNHFKVLPFHLHEIVAALVFGGFAYIIGSKLSSEKPSEEMLNKCF